MASAASGRTCVRFTSSVTSDTTGSTGGTSTGPSGTQAGTTDAAEPHAGGTQAEDASGVEGTASAEIGTSANTGMTQADTAASSTGTAPLCGDDFVEGDEECDDANASDAGDSTHCDDWATGAGDRFAWFGASNESDSNWTHAVKTTCGAGANLICFEQP